MKLSPQDNTEMAWALLSIASNVAPEEHVSVALEKLRSFVHIEALSSFFQTKAIGRPEQPDYLNGVVSIRTERAPLSLKNDVLRRIEAELGRVRTEDRYAARCIDLDLLHYEETTMITSELTLPDPDILTRPFLSAGILELAPHITLPDDARPLAARIDSGVLAQLTIDRAFTQRLKEQFNP